MFKISFERNPRKRKRRKKHKAETAKLFIGGVMVIYFAAVIFGGIVTWNYPENLPSLFTFVGAPTTAALGFYCWKAKAENVKKLELNPEFLKNDGESESEVEG